MLESDRAGLRRSRIRTALVSAAVAGFALVGGAANYVWVNAPWFFSSAEPDATSEAETSPEEESPPDAPLPVPKASDKPAPEQGL